MTMTDPPTRRWPVVVVGGGPAAALQVRRAAVSPTEMLVISAELGGGMGFLGPLRLQSYAEELTVGSALGDLQRRTDDFGIQPTGGAYHGYVADAIATSGAACLLGTVSNVYPERVGLSPEADPDCRTTTGCWRGRGRQVPSSPTSSAATPSDTKPDRR
jgi:hypothetical protein